MLSEIASRYLSQNRPLSAFSPYAPASDRTAWEGLDEEWRQKSLALGEKYSGFSWPYLCATDFMDFSRTGNRVRFEDRFFLKRHALNALVLAECVEYQGRFLDDILNGLFSICDENAWNLPPHNSYAREAAPLLLPDLSAPVLDLFACETGAVLATALYLLSDALDSISPLVGKRVRFELERRIFTPYLNEHFWWMGDGRSPMNNWTIWCTQNVLLSAFLASAQDLDNARRQRIFWKACESADYFLAEYGTDGCCDEGAQYYRHAGLCLFQVLFLCDSITQGAFESLFAEEKIRNIASYIFKVHIGDIYYINFADCSPVAGRAGVREFLFAQRTRQEDMAAFSAIDFKAGGDDTLLLPEENNLFYRLQNGFCAAAIKAFSPFAPLRHPDVCYPSTGLFAVRGKRLFLAVKAGDNGDSHNHNDTGSFTVYKDTKPLFIDVGVESYTQKTFSAQRYEIWTMQSAYHNLPTIDGVMQKDGEDFRATGVSWDLEAKSIQMELKNAYPPLPGLLSYRRFAQLDENDTVTIRDRAVFSDEKKHQVVLSLMTYEKPVAEQGTDLPEGCVRLQIGEAPKGGDQQGAFGSLTVKGACVSAIEEIPVTDARLQKAWKHSLYRILLSFTGPDVTLLIQ